MNFLIFLFILFSAGFSYSQQFRPVGSGLEAEISACLEWSTPANSNEPERCLSRQTCSIQLYTTEEPVVVVCQCHVRRSSKHPSYSQNDSFDYWNFNGVHLDRNAAEEEAREGCSDDINRIIGAQNPDHWVSSIKCGVRYRYVCEDGSVEMRTSF